MIAKCNSDASRRRGGEVLGGVVSNSELIIANIDHCSDQEVQIGVERDKVTANI